MDVKPAGVAGYRRTRCNAWLAIEKRLMPYGQSRYDGCKGKFHGSVVSRRNWGTSPALYGVSSATD